MKAESADCHFLASTLAAIINFPLVNKCPKFNAFYLLIGI